MIEVTRAIAGLGEATADDRAALVRAIDVAKRAVMERCAAETVRVTWTEARTPRVLRIEVEPCGSRSNALVRGDTDDPLLPHLAEQLVDADRVDVVVAFVLEGGVRRLMPYFEDLLARGGRLRLLTGDYLGVTEPDALERLLDLGDGAELRVFGSRGQSFHPKAWVFRREDGRGVAFVGSSNLSKSALEEGIEWNYRVVGSGDVDGFTAVCDGFERVFGHRKTTELTHEWIAAYRRRRVREVAERSGVRGEELARAEPTAVQQEALAKLGEWRAEGNRAGLVVMATGLGKTWLAAFASKQFERVLFVAHREEILNQARDVFRRVRRDARLGMFTGEVKEGDADVLFASIQTLARDEHLAAFTADQFDLVVIDEFHHAAARTYRALLEHFTPKFLLGLTATPERSDGADLLALCGHAVVYRCDLADGIRRDLLCPFEYHGVPDDVDYEQIPWRSSRFDEEALTTALATERRAELALEHHAKHGGARTLAFCASQRHADFMAAFFSARGKRAVAVHTGGESAPRARSLDDLKEGRLDVLFCVDMFNEGVDVPAIDTVMMLRPTESRVIWLQQLGRGLRKAEGKSRLRVIDSIGNHKCFLDKPRALLMALCGIDETRGSLRAKLRALRDGSLELPPGCSVKYELEAVDILERLLRPTRAEDALRDAYEDFRDRHGRRPSAAEMHGVGVLDRDRLHRSPGSWFAFVQSTGELDGTSGDVLRTHGGWFDDLERTPMQRSYQMVVLIALLELGALPGGEASLESISERFELVMQRSDPLRREFEDGTRRSTVRQLLLQGPILAITGTKRSSGSSPFFGPGKDPIRSTITVAPEHRDAFVAMTREIIEWRLAERVDPTNEAGGDLE